MIGEIDLFGPGGHPDGQLNLIDGNNGQGFAVGNGAPEWQGDRVDDQDTAIGRIDARPVTVLDLAEIRDGQAGFGLANNAAGILAGNHGSSRTRCFRIDSLYEINCR